MADPWPAICEQFALRIMAAAYQMGSQVEAMEADEQDPDRLERLYRIDHANTRVRRQAENLQVLAGRQVEDSQRQVTSLLDVIRAAASAIDYYQRICIGRIADLAVVEFAADDVIRVLTELLDNAARFSPPNSNVVVSAHITELGSVLLRVEDAGVGVNSDELPLLNAQLAGDAPLTLPGAPAARLGLVVVQRLAALHQMRVHLSARPSGGTTATVLIPERLLCEIPAASPEAPASPLAGQHRTIPSGPHRPVPRSRRGHAASYRGSAAVQGGYLMLVDPPLTAAVAGEEPRVGGLPRRESASIRGGAASSSAVEAVAEPPTDRLPWSDEVADFAAGVGDAQSYATDLRPEGHAR